MFDRQKSFGVPNPNQPQTQHCVQEKKTQEKSKREITHIYYKGIELEVNTNIGPKLPEIGYITYI